MSKSLQVAALSFALSLVFSAGAFAQQSAQSGVNVAVIDISHVFKNHPRFTAEAERMKGEIKSFEDEINNERQQLVEEGKKLQQFTPGSPDYKRLEEDIARRTAALQLKASLKRKNVLELEAKLYYDTYNQIQSAIKQVATKYNIGLVLRFNSKPIDPNNRNEVLNGINRPVVFQNGIDITPAVMGLVAPTGQAGGPAPRARVGQGATGRRTQ